MSRLSKLTGSHHILLKLIGFASLMLSWDFFFFLILKEFLIRRRLHSRILLKTTRGTRRQIRNLQKSVMVNFEIFCYFLGSKKWTFIIDSVRRGLNYHVGCRLRAGGINMQDILACGTFFIFIILEKAYNNNN